MRSTLVVISIGLSVLTTLVGAPPSSNPSLTLSAPGANISETDQAVVDLAGSVRSDVDLQSLKWVSGLGKRGTGAWAKDGQNQFHWTLPAVPLQLGNNFITVTVVDAAGHIGSLQLAIRRQPLAGTAPEQHFSVALARLGSNGLSIANAANLWPAVGGVYQVPYVIQNGSANLTSAITAFNQTFAGLIEFVTRNAEANYVNIDIEGAFSSEGYSYVGVEGGPQSLTCGGGCTVATILHEMGHTVGLLHEHQRPDRDHYITLNLANADLPNVGGNFTLFSSNYQAIGLYDFASVMHYGAFDFSQSGMPVMESIPSGIPLSNNNGYSAGDVDQVERLYGHAPSRVTVTTNPSGLQIIVDGSTYTAPQTFNWSLNSSHSVDLPADPQFTNPNDGSDYTFATWNDGGSRSHTINVVGGTGTVVSPVATPDVTVYQANFVRLQPFGTLSPAVYPSGAGTLDVTPSPVSEFGGTFFRDRQLVTLSVTPTVNSGDSFYDWYHLPFPASDNPKTFFIQAPIVNAQAVFVPAPVTIFGESLTGPNTFNPGLYARVDGNYTPLPAGFSSTYNGNGWAAGTTHSVTTDQEQSPVTTNVFFNWNTWSDGGALTHNIVQPNSGTQTITGSFTPFYAYYTVVAPNASCAGTTMLSPTGTSYSANSSFLFYQDGTDVTATASPNTQYNGMQFAGWSGSLSGNSSPEMVTIHNQFVPTANFNTASSPITISGFTPETSAVNPNSADITIHGTGFTANTYTYWNGSYRSNTYLSSTQLTMHLNAGDLGSAGAEDLYASNYPANGFNQTCGVGFDSTYIVSPAVASTNTISGTVTLAGAPLANVAIALSTGATAATNGSGNYSFASLPSGGTYTVTPVLAGYQFTPAASTIANLSGNQTIPFQASAVSGPLGFVSVAPCRLVDTRATNGPLGGPTMTGGSTRSFPVLSGSCGLASSALAYSLNVTVIPHSKLGYLSLWATGQPQPLVSTLNSLDGRIVANAAIVPAGTSGAVNVYVSDQTEVIIDVNGYFGASSANTLTFVPVSPCRVVDTRGGNGSLGGPILGAGANRSFPLASGACSLPSNAAAYSLNATVVPSSTLSYLTLYPTGKTQPTVSTLNSYNGEVVANAALVAAGSGAAVTAYVTNQTQLILDVNGYFTSAPTRPLVFTTVTPCRIVDTRNASGTFGGPILAANSTRGFPIPSSSCGIPASANAYALNITALPISNLSYLTIWPDGQVQPTVSTLNSANGQIVANAALVPAGEQGAVDVFVTDQTNLLIDVVGYFSAP
jgi:hypothetical protein